MKRSFPKKVQNRNNTSRPRRINQDEFFSSLANTSKKSNVVEKKKSNNVIFMDMYKGRKYDSKLFMYNVNSRNQVVKYLQGGPITWNTPTTQSKVCYKNGECSFIDYGDKCFLPYYFQNGTLITYFPEKVRLLPASCMVPIYNCIAHSEMSNDYETPVAFKPRNFNLFASGSIFEGLQNGEFFATQIVDFNLIIANTSTSLPRAFFLTSYTKKKDHYVYSVAPYLLVRRGSPYPLAVLTSKTDKFFFGMLPDQAYVSISRMIKYGFTQPNTINNSQKDENEQDDNDDDDNVSDEEIIEEVIENDQKEDDPKEKEKEKGNAKQDVQHVPVSTDNNPDSFDEI